MNLPLALKLIDHQQNWTRQKARTQIQNADLAIFWNRAASPVTTLFGELAQGSELRVIETGGDGRGITAMARAVCAALDK